MQKGANSNNASEDEANGSDHNKENHEPPIMRKSIMKKPGTPINLGKRPRCQTVDELM